MNKRRRRKRVFFQIMKNSGMNKFIAGYFAFFLICALVVMWADPQFTNYGDSLWYCFVSCTTIGFGDFAAITPIGRIFTVLLYLYTVAVLAIITALFTQFFIQMMTLDRDDSIAEFMDKLENLTELAEHQLEEISEKVKKIRVSR